jgi:hypothetical protein
MKKIFMFTSLAIFVAACGGGSPETKNSKEEKYDFRTYCWGDSQEKITKSEAPKEYKVYDTEGVIEIEYEDTFLGIKSDLDNRIVARMATFYVEDKLKGSWYYIYAAKPDFDLQKNVDEIMKEFGKPVKEFFNEENDSNNYLWKTDRTVVRVLTRDAGEYVRFESYYYERQWYDSNLDGK